MGVPSACYLGMQPDHRNGRTRTMKSTLRSGPDTMKRPSYRTLCEARDLRSSRRFRPDAPPVKM